MVTLFYTKLSNEDNKYNIYINLSQLFLCCHDTVCDKCDLSALVTNSDNVIT